MSSIAAKTKMAVGSGDIQALFADNSRHGRHLTLHHNEEYITVDEMEELLLKMVDEVYADDSI